MALSDLEFAFPLHTGHRTFKAPKRPRNTGMSSDLDIALGAKTNCV